MRVLSIFVAPVLTHFATASVADPAQWVREWPQTDFTLSTIDFDEVISGGPPKDGIPAVWEPAHLPVAQETRLDAREPVLTYELSGGCARLSDPLPDVA